MASGAEVTARVDMDELRAWIGRKETKTDVLCGTAPKLMTATLDRAAQPWSDGTPLPPLWHWFYFLPDTMQSELGADGHAKRGGFLPPVALPRRMWAGGRFEFVRPLRVGTEVRRTSEILRIDAKPGRTGLLVFVCVRHQIEGPDGMALSEEHDIVYRDMPREEASTERALLAPGDEEFVRQIIPDPVLLFRYSALTFNGHRIHYDRDYVREVEGYPGLVVHGPLIATLLLDLLGRQQPNADVRAFWFKARRPIFDGQSFTVCGKFVGAGEASLWVRDHEGRLAMEAGAELRAGWQ